MLARSGAGPACVSQWRKCPRYLRSALPAARTAAPAQTRSGLSLRPAAARARGSFLRPLSRARTRGGGRGTGAPLGSAKLRSWARGRGRLRAAPRSTRSATAAPRGGDRPLLPACAEPRRARSRGRASPASSRSPERGPRLPAEGPRWSPGRSGRCGSPAAARGVRGRPPASPPRLAERAVTGAGVPAL